MAKTNSVEVKEIDKVNINSTDIDKIYYGNIEIDKIYYGEKLVYSSSKK